MYNIYINNTSLQNVWTRTFFNWH